MIICMPTVPHSGTHFLRRRVLKGREQVDGQDRFKMLAPTDDIEQGRDILFTAHYDPKFIKPWIDIVGKYPTVIVLRHPARTIESYIRRPVIGTNRGGEASCTQWDRLLKVAAYFKEVLYLHLDDLTRRVEQGSIIQARFNIPLGIDWAVGEDVNTKVGTHAWEIPADYDVPQEYVDFYEETKNASTK